MNQIVADRYAEALFQLAVAGQSAGTPESEAGRNADSTTAQGALVDKVDHDLTLVTQTLAETPDLRRLLLHPLVRRGDKRTVIVSLFGPHVAPVTLNFLQLLFDRGRGPVLEMVQSRFHHLAAKRARKLNVKLTTAVAIGPEQLAQFEAILAHAWQRHVEVEAQVDGDLLGGAVLRVEDEVVDGSVRGRLDALKHAMSQG